MLTIERLREVLHYDPATGIFRWKKVARCSKFLPGDQAGWHDEKDYVRIEIDGRAYRAHRLAWAYVTGQHPTHQIDHKNRKRDDNRFDNLRPATNAQNCANSAGKKTRKNKLKGAHPHQGRWRAWITVNYKVIRLGHFATEQEAHDAYVAAAKLHFGEFANAGH